MNCHLCRKGWSGELGDGTWQSHSTPAPVAGGAQGLFASMAAGWEHTCGVIAASRRIACFGSGSYYQLGGDTAGKNVPTTISDGGAATYRAVTCGAYHTCALRTDGQVMSLAGCGENNTGPSANASDALHGQQHTAVVMCANQTRSPALL